MNSSLAYRIGSTSVNDTRSTSELVKLNSTGQALFFAFSLFEIFQLPSADNAVD